MTISNKTFYKNLIASGNLVETDGGGRTLTWVGWCAILIACMILGFTVGVGWH
jgi:hypothetical protein